MFQTYLFFDLGLDQHPRARLARYERLVTNPSSELREICQFIGVGYEGRMARGVHGRSIAKDPPPNIEPRIREHCEGLLAHLDSHIDARNAVESAQQKSVSL